MQALLSSATLAGTPRPFAGLGNSTTIRVRHFNRSPLVFNRYEIRTFPPSCSLPFCSALPPEALPTTHRSLAYSSYSHPLLVDFTSSPRKKCVARTPIVSSTISPSSASHEDEYEGAKFAQVSKRLENTSRYFKRLGSYGFWSQLVCSVVAAVILSSSLLITGKITSPATFYSTGGGIVAAFISVFWSFGYLRLSDMLRKTANEPSKAPTRGEVMRSLKNGIVLNLVGMAAAMVGMLATVGSLLAKALTGSSNPFRGIPSGNSPVLALDIFLVQASTNTILSHFLGLVFSLELLRSVTQPQSGSIALPKSA